MSARATENAQASQDPEGAAPDGEPDVVDPFEEDEAEDDLAGGLGEEALDEELDPGDDGDDGDDVTGDIDQLAADDDSDDEQNEAPAVAVVPPDAEFDDDAPVAPVDDEDDDDEEIEGLRDGEFVCRGCFMAKRETQLADADALLCRDCA